MWLYLAFAIFIFVASIIYLRLSLGICTSSNRMDDKVVIVTGATAGIGFETAKDLARRGAQVVLACRSAERGRDAMQRIQAAQPSAHLDLRIVDLSSLKSVRQFCKHFAADYSRLDVLINNAGVAGYHTRTLTEDGLEIHMASNHFGHFLLTTSLIGLLEASKPSRVINVSSITNLYGVIEMDNLNGERYYNRHRVYGDSKLANILFTKELHRRYAARGIYSFSLHPGSVYTQLACRIAVEGAIWLALKIGFAKTTWEGAQTSIHLAVADGMEKHSGQFFMDCAPADWWTCRQAADAQAARDLWVASDQLVASPPGRP